MLLDSKKKPFEIAEILPLLANISNKKQEHFVVLTFDSRMQLLGNHLVFLGTVDATICHPREIFATAIADSASAIILSHNHPSGDPTPSKQDTATTIQIIAAGMLMGIDIYDHVIVAGIEHYSFRENGQIRIAI